MFKTKFKTTATTLLALAINTYSYAEDRGADFDDLYMLTNEKSMVDEMPAEKLSNRAFEVLMEEMFPTTPEQLRKIQEREREINRVIYDNKEPKPLSDIISVSTRPGEPPRVVHVAPMHVSSINIIDVTGQPWPIESISTGNAIDYTASVPAAHAHANVFQVVPLRETGTTNLNIYLAGYPLTIPLILKNSTDKYYPSAIIQIDREGPQAKPSQVFTLESGKFDLVLKDIVIGVTPNNFERLKTNDRNVEAWRFNEDIFIRTSYRAMSPLPRGIYHGPSNYVAYRMANIPVVVFTNQNGLEVKVVIE